LTDNNKPETADRPVIHLNFDGVEELLSEQALVIVAMQNLQSRIMSMCDPKNVTGTGRQIAKRIYVETKVQMDTLTGVLVSKNYARVKLVLTDKKQETSMADRFQVVGDSADAAPIAPKQDTVTPATPPESPSPEPTQKDE
jgi:hypothetical protein